MKSIKPKISSVLATVALVACGAGSKPLNELALNEASFRMEAASSSVVTKAAAALRVNDDGSVEPAGTGVTLSTLKVYVGRIDLHLPEGVVCPTDSTVAAEHHCSSDDSSDASNDDSLKITARQGDDDPATHDINDDNGGSSSNSSDDNEDHIKIEGPWVFDLIAKTSTPALDTIKVPAGTYRKIKVRLDKGKVADGVITAGDVLEDRSLYAEGTFKNTEGSTVPFKLRLAFDEDIKIRKDAGIAIGEGEFASFILKMDVDKWFTGIDLPACMAAGDIDLTDGVLLLDDNQGRGRNSCSDIENTIKDNIKESFEAEHE